MMDQSTAEACVAHIRAAARCCEDAGMLAAWATLMGVADDIVAKVEMTSPREN